MGWRPKQSGQKERLRLCCFFLRPQKMSQAKKILESEPRRHSFRHAPSKPSISTIPGTPKVGNKPLSSWCVMKGGQPYRPAIQGNSEWGCFRFLFVCVPGNLSLDKHCLIHCGGRIRKWKTRAIWLSIAENRGTSSNFREADNWSEAFHSVFTGNQKEPCHFLESQF